MKQAVKVWYINDDKIYQARRSLMVWLTLGQSLEEPSKFHMKKKEQFVLIMWTYS